jgi:hypothetical protein
MAIHRGNARLCELEWAELMKRLNESQRVNGVLQ